MPSSKNGSGEHLRDVLLQLAQGLRDELHPQQTGTITLDSALDRELGLDSLARMELLSRIERRLGVALPEHLLTEAASLRDLWRALQTSQPDAAAPARHVVAHATAPVRAAPQQAQTLLDVLAWQTEADPDGPHIRFYRDEDDGDILSCGQLSRQAHRVAAGLQRQGLTVGETVALMLPTGPDYFHCFFGTLLAGGIPVPIYPPVRRTQLEEHLRRHRWILDNCRARFLITPPEAQTFSRLLRALLSHPCPMLTPAELATDDGWQQPAIQPHDIAFLQYTSGSTGTPKGVVLTHENLLANIRAMGARLQVDNRDVFVSWLPLYHDMGLIGAWLGSLYFGVRLVLLSPLQFLSRPQRWLWAIHRYHGTLSAAPNFGYSLCLHRPREEDLTGLDLSSWRAACNGAEAVSPDTLEGFAARFARYGFRREALLPVYGLAENTVGLTFPPPGRAPRFDRVLRAPLTQEGLASPAEDKEDAVIQVGLGPPLEGHDVRIVDAAGHELPERREGELQFRGPSASSGYYRNPEATRRLFQGDWLNSGDLAYMADGDIFITGRRKDVIIRAGRNIHPQELEEAVGGLPGVRKGNVAVFGSRRAGDELERLVVLAETRETEAAARDTLLRRIQDLAVERLDQPPDEVILAPPGSVLKTSSGKIRRSACRQAYEQGALGRSLRPSWWQLVRMAASTFQPVLRRSRQALTALLFAGYGWGLYYLLAAGVVLAVGLLPRLSWRWAAVRTGVRIWRWACGIPLTITHLAPLPTDPCILVANHASYLDAYALIAALPGPLCFVAKAELRKKPAIRWLLERLGTAFVERFAPQQAVDDARRLGQLAQAGHRLCFFPEGTFTRQPGLRPFHLGAFITAVDAGLPVVPIALRGTRSMLRSDSWFPRRGAIALSICPPLPPPTVGDTADDSWAAALQLRAAARNAILHHCGEPLRDDLPPQRPAED